jgi:integrase
MRGGFNVTFIRGLRKERKTVISEDEFREMLAKAEELKPEFFKLRAKALLCILRLTGKRRGEVAQLQLGDFKVESGFLNITFRLEKKKRSFKVCAECGAKNVKNAKFCRQCGFDISNAPVQKRGKQAESVKAIPLSDPYVKPILDYLAFLDGLEPKPKFVFPSVKSLFGEGLIIYPDKHLTGRQIFNIVRGLSTMVWPHLFRETVAAEVVKRDPSLIGAFRVRRRLDLESFQTGFNYLKRYAADIIEREVMQVES